MENPTITSGFELEGTYHLDCFDNEAKRQEWLLTSDPSLIKWSGDIKNKIVNQGLNYLLNCIFYKTAKLSNSWYLGLVVTNTAATAGMTYATPPIPNQPQVKRHVRPVRLFHLPLNLLPTRRLRQSLPTAGRLRPSTVFVWWVLTRPAQLPVILRQPAACY